MKEVDMKVLLHPHNLMTPSTAVIAGLMFVGIMILLVARRLKKSEESHDDAGLLKAVGWVVIIVMAVGLYIHLYG